MDNFGLKIEAFKQIFFEQNGYQKVIEGLQNTLIIAIAGLLIGIIIGTVFNYFLTKHILEVMETTIEF